MRTLNAKLLGKEIYDLRSNNSITLEDLSKEMHVNKTVVSKWEVGKRVPNLAQIIKMAEYFNVPYNDIVSQAIADDSNEKEVKTTKTRKISTKKLIILLAVCLVVLSIPAFFIIKNLTRNGVRFGKNAVSYKGEWYLMYNGNGSSSLVVDDTYYGEYVVVDTTEMDEFLEEYAKSYEERSEELAGDNAIAVEGEQQFFSLDKKKLNELISKDLNFSDSKFKKTAGVKTVECITKEGEKLQLSFLSQENKDVLYSPSEHPSGVSFWIKAKNVNNALNKRNQLLFGPDLQPP